jgi:hypothetical protein
VPTGVAFRFRYGGVTMPGYACPNCHRPVRQRPLSSIGIGNVKIWRGCDECFATSIIAALKALNLPSQQQSPPDDIDWWLIDRSTRVHEDEGRS